MKLSEVAVTEVLIYYQFYKEGTGGSGRHAQKACMKMWVIIARIFAVFVLTGVLIAIQLLASWICM